MENLPQNPETQEDLLEKLLAGAAEREAQKAMAELEKKGTVTKAEFSTALSEFEQRLLDKIGEITQKAAAPVEAPQTTEEETVQKAGGRRSTITGATDPRSDNPVRYILQKSRSGQEYDQTDKELIWGLTMKGLTQGMSMTPIDGDDFADEYTD